MHDYVLVYQKSQKFNRFLLPRTDKQDGLYKFESNDGKGKWRPDNLTVKTVSDAYLYEIQNPNTGKKYFPPKGRCWLTSSSKIEEWITEGRVFFGKNNDGAPQLKRYLNEVQQGIIPNTYWSYDEVGHTDSARKELKKIFEGNAPFDNPKPTGLLKKIFQIATQPEDLIVDFFAGSGTTGEAVMRLNAEDGGNRQFILVQIPQPIDAKKQKEAHAFVTDTLQKPEATIFEITAERLRRAGAKIEAELAAKALAAAAQPAQLEGFAPAVDAKPTPIDTGFRVFELVNDPEALILSKPLQHATQADVLALQTAIATPQPAQLPRVLHNLLLSESLPLTTVLRTVKDQCLYLAGDVLMVVHAVALDELTDTLRALQAQGTPATYLTVYAPWIADDNFMLGIKTVAESLGYSDDKLRLRG